MEYHFKNRVVVITGGGSGIGLAIATAFAKAAANVIILGRNRRKLRAAQKQIRQYGSCEIYTADVAKISSVRHAVAQVLKQFKKIDILVTCAGLYGPIGPFAHNNLQDWQGAFAINFLGMVNCVYTALPAMLKAGRGKIITLSGGGAVQPFPNFSSYATSKAAVVRFTETVAREYEKQNIQINAIAPGAVNTSVLAQVLKTGEKKVGREFWKKSLEQKRSGGDNPEVAAELVLFLCSEAGAGLSGKLVSAKWDQWRQWSPKRIKKIQNSSLYTLRRIDNKYFAQK